MFLLCRMITFVLNLCLFVFKKAKNKMRPVARRDSICNSGGHKGLMSHLYITICIYVINHHIRGSRGTDGLIVLVNAASIVLDLVGCNDDLNYFCFA